MKKYSAVIFTTILGVICTITASAKLESVDQGIYIVTDKDDNVLVGYRFTSMGKYWTTDILQNNQWNKVVCTQNKPCRLTNSSKATMKRFFAKHPDVIKVIDKKFSGISLSCADVKEFAFCKLSEPQNATYLLINEDSTVIVLNKYQPQTEQSVSEPVQQKDEGK
ncbi:hypothetical protein CFY87_10005 [Actinobacillus seminis]|uniref:Uncharacterized protein n=1 Tax=Actinobacillus seminis TaxID=722 RepID=A0A263H9Y0_9PAST|nr:hypothetical protein [Actinobacillus seminis]OZN24254.1 hypothetical protein CFY87_10005 [Actinobacillus seminis]SUU37606.1 Uncharacterised protein [Actinobacillus seminis]